MRVLLVAPYCGGSHRAWAEGYVAHSGHDITLLSLPARFWRWRMQGGAVTLAEEARALEDRPDLILASDMLNLPLFLALARDFLSDVPTALYFHENQLTYPLPPGKKRDLTYGMINWLSMLAAGRVFFNSRYHLEDWFEALPNMLKHFPDYGHLHYVDEVRQKATVLPVGCDLSRLDAAPGAERPDDPPLILWNQRWEYDKDPETFLRALYALDEAGMTFRVAIAGKNHHHSAPQFDAASQHLASHVVHFGYAEDETYAALLHRADVVVSTAVHEFFGVAVVEAIYSGCLPVLPDRLSYPELIPESAHEACIYRGYQDLVARLGWAVTHRQDARAVADELRDHVAQFDWAQMAPVYDRHLAEVT